jgi:hypothetical protein
LFLLLSDVDTVFVAVDDSLLPGVVGVDHVLVVAGVE